MSTELGENRCHRQFLERADELVPPRVGHGRDAPAYGEKDGVCHLINPAEMPNAGFKHSGDGTDLSLLGLENYTRLKHVMSALGG